MKLCVIFGCLIDFNSHTYVLFFNNKLINLLLKPIFKLLYVSDPINKILMSDETLTNLTPYFDALKNAGAITQPQRDALTPYVQVRQSAATDIIPLSTGSILGTLVGGDPTKVYGVTVPAADQYVLIPTEIAAIRTARDGFNATIAATATANTSKLALADVSAALASMKLMRFSPGS